MNIRKIKEGLNYHLATSTAVLAESTPVFSVFETGVAGMSDEVSTKSRLMAAGLCYLGLGFIYGKGRDLWRRTFGIKQTSREWVQDLHDGAYTAVFNTVISPPIYILAGSKDVKEMAIATACSAGFGAINGIPMGWVTDAFLDLTNIRQNERSSYPELLRRQSSRTKKGLAALLVAGSLALTSGIYSISPNRENQDYEQPTKNHVLEANYSESP